MAMTELHRGFNFRHDVSPLSDVDKADALTLNRHKARPSRFTIEHAKHWLSISVIYTNQIR